MIDKTKSKGRIERWAGVLVGDDVANAPLRIGGRFEVSPGFWKDIVTSSVVDADGKFVETRSGSVYELGTIDPEYAKEIELQRPGEFDPENPIRFVDERKPWVAREVVDKDAN